MAVKYGAVNLGQGFPNWSPPAFLLRASHQAIDGATRMLPSSDHSIFTAANLTPAMGSVIHQYSRPAGHLRLVSALSALYSPLIGRNVDPMTEIQVVAGASDGTLPFICDSVGVDARVGLFTAVLALVDPGDEVIVFAPYYDLYEGSASCLVHQCGSSVWTLLSLFAKCFCLIVWVRLLRLVRN